ncbi:hypothetical protein ACHAWF_007908 [Thalassiosira exigua]
MDPNSLASRYLCKKCGDLPKQPFVAEDGNFYHEACIPTETKFTAATTIKCVIEKILATEDYDQCLSSEDVNGNTVKIDEVLEKAELGSSKDMARLGRWYLLGEQEGIEFDEDKAYYWSKKAADQSDGNGMAYLAMCLIHGYGVDQCWSDGFDLFLDAAYEENSAYAAYQLGCNYFAGVHGFKDDRKKAQKWLKRAKDSIAELSPYEQVNVRKYLASMGSPSSRIESGPEDVDLESQVGADLKSSANKEGLILVDAKNRSRLLRSTNGRALEPTMAGPRRWDDERGGRRSDGAVGDGATGAKRIYVNRIAPSRESA